MQVRFKRAPHGWLLKEFISRQYDQLEKLREEYIAKGAQTWMNIYDHKRWVVTVWQKVN